MATQEFQMTPQEMVALVASKAMAIHNGMMSGQINQQMLDAVGYELTRMNELRLGLKEIVAASATETDSAEAAA